MIIGYARVSSTDQHLDAQIKALKEAGAEKIFTDQKSGKSLKDRKGLKETLHQLKAGDTLIITKMDRIARNVREGISLIDEMADRRIKLHVLNMGVFDSSPTSKLLRNILLSVAEWEREMILERQREGIALAKQNGKYSNKPRKYTENHIGMQSAIEDFNNRVHNKLTVRQICEKYKVTRSALYNKVKELEELEKGDGTV
ncbi:recombinase family protein [Listeria booriae]|uniref:recombinase family protein n=1 Tax=Listeria booriae TaxID=1552123 RepID=UPI0016250F0E|nr:recombinase family protein [Listeria booriae]MBC2392008.1 recombinase family protein [Listeria booriae]